MSRNESRVELVDEFLFRKVLDRLGRTEGHVVIQSEYWDLGFCETCSYPESGFAVYVDDELVWPNEESLSALGGYIYADDSGYVVGGELSTYGYFYDWLDGLDADGLEALSDAKDEADMAKYRAAEEARKTGEVREGS